uniref:SURP motif domain-containing protein n=1 Tax=Stomoxys calcitrans TaxID=35570 RepID=A0A1I8PZF0_STOCA
MSFPRNDTHGILRKTSTTEATVPERHMDLLVFGYACKIFRDDAKAREIDQGKHLIPWMNENSLKIDRYDVRGALYDLTPYEPPPGGYENRLDYLTADEQRAEQLCEEERYLFLYKNEEDVITKQEEELKRLKQETNGGGYSQVGFSYDQSQPIGPSREEYANSPTCEEPEQLFTLPHNFEVPPEMHLPETMKQHAIIEKTARFIASQGAQMEILLKAKQSNNVQFEFLSQNSVLNPYYKYVINAIKNGSYPDIPEVRDSGKDDEDISNDTTNDATSQKPVVVVPMVKYKPSADCAYTQLISKIKGVPLSELHDESSRHSNGTQQQESAGESPSITPVLLQYNGATFMTEHDDSSDSNGCKVSATNTNQDNLNDSGPKVEILKNSSALALAQNYSSDSESENGEDTAARFEKEKTPPNLEFPVPTENLKNIIDKTAVYVIKNGRQFEETLRSKSAERFTFLLPDNEFYPYYMYKITGDHNAASKERKQRKAKEVAEALLSKKGLTRDKAATNTVSFSIKNKDECATTALQNTVLPQDPSDDEDKVATSSVATPSISASTSTSTSTSISTNTNASNQQARHVPIHVQKAIELVESQLMARNAQIAAAAALALRQTNVIPVKNVLPTITPTHASKSSGVSGASAATGKEAERNAIFEQQQQQRHKELKKAEEKVKDKLAQIAREKLGGLVSKEKQLQLERKRKAMAFLNQIKAVTSGENYNPVNDEQASEKMSDSKDILVSEESDDSVRSIPITSYGPEENSEEENTESLRPHKIPTHIEQSKVTRTKLTKTVEPDHVSLIPDLNSIRKRKSRSRSRDHGESLIVSAANKRQYRKQESHSSSCLSDNNEEEPEKLEKFRSKSRSKSKSHKSKKSKSKKSKSKRKSKKRTKSKSRTRSRSRSHSNYRSTTSGRGRSVSSDSSTTDSQHHHHYKEKRRRYECS